MNEYLNHLATLDLPPIPYKLLMKLALHASEEGDIQVEGSLRGFLNNIAGVSSNSAAKWIYWLEYNDYIEMTHERSPNSEKLTCRFIHLWFYEPPY